MSYVAIYRKFRPQTFAQVKGQESIVRTLQNQIKNDRIGHAYLFTGTRGTGKTSVARIFAKAINCTHQQDGEPCNVCESCQEIAGGSHMDVIEIDAASNTGVDDIRRVIEEVQYTPVAGKYKVYIIDEAHMLSGAASNAFLKTLEEPPEYAVFILATTEPHRLPVTILSRCQRYDFKRITTDKIVENIFTYLEQEGIQAEEKAVRYIARAGDGSMRDSLSLLDKAIAFHLGEPLTYENTLSALGTVDTEVFSRMFRSVLSADAYSAVAQLDSEVQSGKDISRFVNDFVWYLRNLLLLQVGDGKEADMLGLSEENLKALKEDARLAEAEVLMRYIRILSELMNQLRFSNAKQVLADVAVIKLARPQMETDTGSLLDRVRQLEAKLVGNIVPVAAPTPPRVPEPISVQQPAPEPMPKSIPAPAVYSGETEYLSLEQYAEVFEQPAEPPRMAAPQAADTDPAPQSMQQPAPASQEPKENRFINIEETNTGGGGAYLASAAWPQIKASCTSPLLKVYLKDAEAAALDAETLHIHAASDLAETRLESKKEELRTMIRSVTGREVKLVISQEAAAQDAPMPPAAQTAFTAPAAAFAAAPLAPEPEPDPAAQTEEEKIEALLRKNIKMNIETEEA